MLASTGNSKKVKDSLPEKLFVHIVPHSYNMEFLSMVDVYFPSM